MTVKIMIFILGSIYYILLFSELHYSYAMYLNGRYTKKIKNYNLIVPHKVSNEGEFITFHIPNFFKQKFGRSKMKRSLENDDSLNYRIRFLNRNYYLTLWPNHEFISPDAVIEDREPKKNIKEREINKVNTEKLCHYIGIVKNFKDSKAAFSACNGLAGFMIIGERVYFIEPLENHQANEYGQHLHLIYKRKIDTSTKKICGVTCDWRNAWRENLKRKLIEQRLSAANGIAKRESKSINDIERYLELLVVSDKEFMKYHKRIHDIETYILTVINMVSQIFHDPSIGFDIDLQVVRLIYLQKEEEENNLVITPNANETLSTFCNWQTKINPPDLKNPNHHDIAVLLTRSTKIVYYSIRSRSLTFCGESVRLSDECSESDKTDDPTS